VTYLGAIVRSTDSSLLDEWERMRTGGGALPVAAEGPGEADITRSEKELTVLVRNSLFAVLRHLSKKEYVKAAALLVAGEWTADRLEQRFAAFWAEHASLRIDPEARSPKNTRVVSRDDGVWRVEQTLLDPEDANDWVLELRMDVDRTRAEGTPLLELVDVAS
ncbi:MAG TPA: DUF3516 domain-containing protein, partial [Polyangiaceae bacterium]|nr:DUF3516 domain-containing protein [Polyangiaceae bacterium]